MTRTVKPVEELIRFVVGPQGVVPDLKRKLPGRGLWITADRGRLADAVARKVFARGFKRDVRVEPATGGPDRAAAGTAAVLDALAIAGKSGLVATGFSKVEAALAHGKVAALLHAAEAKRRRRAPSLPERLRQRTDAEQIAIVGEIHDGPIGFGTGPVKCGTCSGCWPDPQADTFLARFARLERFRTGEPGRSGGKPVHGTDRIEN